MFRALILIVEDQAISSDLLEPVDDADKVPVILVY